MLISVTGVLISVSAVHRKDVIRVYDGSSLSSPPINISLSSGKALQVLSRFNAVVIVYNKTAASSLDATSSVSLQVHYSMFSKSVCVYACVCMCMRVCVYVCVCVCESV